jgi:hypothetical protein
MSGDAPHHIIRWNVKFFLAFHWGTGPILSIFIKTSGTRSGHDFPESEFRQLGHARLVESTQPLQPIS